MEYLTVQQTAIKWGVSDRMVRYYCTSGLVPGAHQEGKSWMVPASATKPNLNASAKEKVEFPPLAKKLKNQKKKRNYHGLYDYTILNLTYSSCRMASSRLTRAQVENIIKKGKAQATFEPIKISDLIETRNHVECVNEILEAPMEQLTPKYLRDLHCRLFEGTVDERLSLVTAGVFRKPNVKIKGRTMPPAKEISGRIERLIRTYEEKEKIDLQDILDFHVQFEGIVPFDDGNGRVGRLILFKECLRHDVMPFIIDDKRRGRYLEGIREWGESRDTLQEVVLEAQQRYVAQIELQKLMAANREFLPANYVDGGE